MTQAWGHGLATITDDGIVLDTWYRSLGLGDPGAGDLDELRSAERHDEVRGVRIEAVAP